MRAHQNPDSDTNRNPRRDWRKALMAMRGLVRDKGGSRHVIAIVRALSGPAPLNGYLRLLRTASGGRIAYNRVELLTLLSDRTWIESFPAKTVGSGYAQFMASGDITARGLAEEASNSDDTADLDAEHPYAWFARRLRDSHDLWHVLTGYGREGLGEACLVAFTYAQTGSLGWGVVALAAFANARDTLGGEAGSGRAARHAILEGYRRGRDAAWLVGEDCEQLMVEPLAAARERLRLAPARRYLSVPEQNRNREAGTGGAEFTVKIRPIA